MGGTFLDSIEARYGGEIRAEVSGVLAAADLPDPDEGEYFRGTEANMLFLDRYGIILRVGEAGNAPAHDLILRPLRSIELKSKIDDPISISILPGVEGVARSWDEVIKLRKRLAADGVELWDGQNANCGYIRCSLPGFDKGVLVVVDRGAVGVGTGLGIGRFLRKVFKANAVYAGVQEKTFGPFLEVLGDWPPGTEIPDRDSAKTFLYKWVTDIHKGQDSTLCNEWGKNADRHHSTKPLRVVEIAGKYEARLKQRDGERCRFYASLRLDR